VIEASFSLIKDSFFTEVTGWENRYHINEQLTVEIKMRVHFNTEISFVFFLSAVNRVKNGPFNKRTFDIALIAVRERVVVRSENKAFSICRKEGVVRIDMFQ
jgi:hypothetical protein